MPFPTGTSIENFYSSPTVNGSPQKNLVELSKQLSSISAKRSWNGVLLGHYNQSVR